MKKLLLFLSVAAVILLGCVTPTPAGNGKATSGLGSLCGSEEGCNNFCENNFGQCQEYCRAHPQNELCQKPFAFQTTPESVGDYLTPVPTVVEVAPTISPILIQPPRDEKPEMRGCQGTGPVRLTAPPIRVDEILTITPMGQMGGGHVTPTDHQYWGTPDWHAGPLHDILSPAKGVITLIQRSQRPVNNYANASLGDDYRIIIYHSCTFYSIFIHPKKLSPRVQQLVGEFRSDGNNYVSIPVEAGEVIAYATATDFSVHNTETRLSGFVTPALYASEEWKIHTVDPFDYFDEPLRGQLLAKTLRWAPPLGGKIDFDVDGKLVGNWFLQNTSYSGTGPSTTNDNYWQGHVSFAYNNIDASLPMFSSGDYNGESKQFALKGSDPATIGVESGLVKYELTLLDYFLSNNSYWDRRSYQPNIAAKADSVVQGVVLAQLLETRKLKLEIFPGKKGGEVNGFTGAAKLYER